MNRSLNKKKKTIIFIISFIIAIAITTSFVLCKVTNHQASKTPIKNIYLAGPFFNDTEIKNIEYAENILQEKGLSFFSPLRHDVDAERGTAEWSNMIFNMDVEAIKKADAVVVMYYASNSDTGTAWECGYAYSIGKPVVVVHVDRNSDSNLMVHCGCTTNIYLEDLANFDFEQMPVYEYSGKIL